MSKKLSTLNSQLSTNHAFPGLINQFIELRVRNITYAQIAADLKINRNTALRWGQKHQAEIDALAAVEAEALRHKFLGSREQEIEMLSKRLQRLETEIDPQPRLYAKPRNHGSPPHDP